MIRVSSAISLTLAIGLFFGRAAAVPADELDPLKATPQTTRMLFENEWVRVLEAKVPPGGREPKHRHRAGVAVFLTAIEVESKAFPGEAVSRLQLKAGEVTWNEARIHEVNNVGKTAVHVILVELKKEDQVRGVFNPDLDPVKVAADTHKLLLENQYVRVIEAKVPPGKHESKHRHPHGVTVYLADADVQIQTFPDGKPTPARRRFGTALWSEATVHEVHNVGKTPLHAIRIELKD